MQERLVLTKAGMTGVKRRRCRSAPAREVAFQVSNSTKFTRKRSYLRGKETIYSRAVNFNGIFIPSSYFPSRAGKIVTWEGANLTSTSGSKENLFTMSAVNTCSSIKLVKEMRSCSDVDVRKSLRKSPTVRRRLVDASNVLTLTYHSPHA